MPHKPRTLKAGAKVTYHASEGDTTARIVRFSGFGWTTLELEDGTEVQAKEGREESTWTAIPPRRM